MTNYEELIRILSVPRPNGSQAERETSRALQRWLRERDIPFKVHTFRNYPYFFEAIGVWIILSRTLLALSIWLSWGWLSLPVAILGLIGGTLDQAFHLPIVTWPGAKQGENIIIEFEPADPKREIIISAHYDSKTELLDHMQRMILLKSIPLGLALTVILGLLGPVYQALAALASPLVGLAYWMGVLLSLPLLALSWLLGLNLSLGRFVKPSRGTVDNGTACAILLGLAEHLKHNQDAFVNQPNDESPLHETRITLALFTGEEVNLQGSRAYARWRARQKGGWALPAAAINMEAMAQDGDYVYWERDGSIFRLVPTDAGVNDAIIKSVTDVSGSLPLPGGPVISDGSSFIAAGLPVGVMGTYHSRLTNTGFHRPSDNPDRVKMERLPEGVEILVKLVEYLHVG